MRVLQLLGVLNMDESTPKAQSFLEGSIELARNLEAWPNVAQGQLSLADNWLKISQPARAVEAIDRATSIYEKLECSSLAEKAHAVRRSVPAM
jgi:hypothetical protein